MERFTYNDWKININVTMGDIDVFCCDEQRGYQIPEQIEKLEQKDEYVYVYVSGGDFYQFKFEEGNFLVGDKFDKDSIYLESFSCHVFGEEEKQPFATMISDGHDDYWSYFESKFEALEHFLLLSLHPEEGTYLFAYNEELGYEVIDSKCEEV
ncbi:unnamed protein product [marine sediment metagenome]|uniref:Uncharacterized protein n=1 Tax=marine sediment metagenome TaxID=412755 RepID=X1BCP2_9ZZZZ